jgi:hypothetical protein
MAYQNVGTPRFYIDYFTYWKSVGLVDSLKSLNYNGNEHDGYFIGLNPSLDTIISQNDNIANASADKKAFAVSVDLKEAIPNNVLDSINFGGVLGTNINNFDENINECNSTFIAYRKYHADAGIGSHDGMGNITPFQIENSNIINARNNNLKGFVVEDKGCSLSKLNFRSWADYNENINEVDRFVFRMEWINESGLEEVLADGQNWNLNTLLLGHYYDMPHSPDLNLSIDIEFDGYDQLTTQGGATITNVRYTGNPSWAGNNAWEIGDSNPYYKRNGRRVWSLKFSFLSDTDIFSSNHSSNNYLNAASDNSAYNSSDLNSEGNQFEFNLSDDNSFSAKVLNFISSGQRFIFQPDNTNSNSDQFAICVLDQDSLTIKQSAFKLYDVSLKIREVW